MANIKLISVDITGDKELVKVLREFSALVTLSKDEKTLESRQQEQKLLNQAETTLASRLGAKVLGGKIGQEEVVDFELTPASPLIKLLYNKVFGRLQEEERFGATRIEFKASTEGEITVGQITLGGKTSTFAVPGTGEVLTEEELFKNLDISGKGYLLDLDTRVPPSGDITNLVFDEYFRLDKKLESIFYNKARNIILSTTSTSNGTTNRLAIVQFPKKYFNKDFFKASRSKNAIVISINTNFQRYIQNTLNESHISAIKRVKPIRKNFTVDGKQYGVDFLSRNILEGNLSYGFEVTNSLKARPADTFFVSFSSLPRQKKQQTQRQPQRQQFISGVQWTVLTQRRLGETMLRFGEPEPPELKERTGRFRSSVQVFANYRTRILQYTYNPLYRSLEKYGYRPDLQVETAIREVAQSLYATRFNIIRTASL
jgi:hypothetical protein